MGFEARFIYGSLTRRWKRRSSTGVPQRLLNGYIVMPAEEGASRDPFDSAQGKLFLGRGCV